MAVSLNGLGLLSSQEGDYPAAHALLSECVQIVQELGDKSQACYALEAWASLAREQRGLERAARLWGAAERLREQISAPLPSKYKEAQDCAVAEVREALGAAVFAATWAEGRGMTMEQAIEYALSVDGAVD